MEPLALAMKNLPNIQDDAYDSGMTNEDYKDLCNELNTKARNQMAELFTTLDTRINLHRFYKADTSNEESFNKFEKFVYHVNELHLACIGFINLADRLN